MSHDNPTWGEERIANELKLKLGIRVSPRTVSKYLPRKRPGGGGTDQRWATFLRNQAKGIVAVVSGSVCVRSDGNRVTANSAL
jgi:hypothetical protein